MVGRTVLQYQLREKLGGGGMGVVYKALDTRLNRFVAIKVLPDGMSADPESRRRFIQEGQAASALNHPNIITIYDVVHEGDTQYMVMEYVTGKTLLELIAKDRLAVPEAIQYASQMADALSAAHSAGIIHRDLKPANVMVTNSGLVKLLDFGLAKLIDWSPGAGTGNTSTLDEARTMNIGARSAAETAAAALVSLALLSSTAAAASIPGAKPEEVGFSSERLQRIHEAVQRRIGSHDIAGAVTLVARRGRVVHSSPTT